LENFFAYRGLLSMVCGDEFQHNGNYEGSTYKFGSAKGFGGGK
jgi:hypothetical protein